MTNEVYPTATIISIYYDAAWHDISSDVVSPITGVDGITGTTPIERVASLGFCSMSLDNVDNKYTPGGTSVIDAEWGRGTPLKVDVTFMGVTENVFWGRVDIIELDTSNIGERNVRISALDYMNVISTFPLKDKATDTNKRIDEAVQSLLDDLPFAPENTELSEGKSTFPTVFDDIQEYTTAVGEFQKLALSEVGFIYIGRGDTVIAESRDDRKGNRKPRKFVKGGASNLLLEDGSALLQEDGDNILLDEATGLFDNTMTDIDMRYGESLINEAYITAFPREISSAPEVVFTLGFYPHLTGTRTETYYGKYADPVGGGDITIKDGIPLVPTTDYLLNEKKDGTGADLTASCTITAEYFADAVLFRFVTTIPGWVIKLQARATIVTTYSPVEVKVSDADSIASYGVNFISIRQKYQQDVKVAQIEAEKILESEREPEREAVSVSFLANNSQLEMLAFLNLRTGDLIHIKENKTEVDSFYYIYGRDYEITQGGIITYRYTIKHARTLEKGLTAIAVEFDEAKSQAIMFPAPAEANDNAKTIIAKISVETFTLFDVILVVQNLINVIGPIRFGIKGDADKCLYMDTWAFSAQLGQWYSTPFSLTEDTEYIVGVSYDSSSIYNLPIFYIDGVKQETFPLGYPEGTNRDLEPENVFVIGAYKFEGVNYNKWDGTIGDVRYYNRVLRDSEHLLSVTDVVQDGLIFQAPCIVTGREAQYIDQVLGEDDKLIDNIYGVIGTPEDGPIGREL